MRYKVKVLVDSALHEMQVTAADQADLERRMAAQGMLLVSARVDRIRSIAFARKRFSISLFTQELVALLEAGLSLIEAVETLCEKCDDPVTEQVLSMLIEHLYQGLTMSAALMRQPHHFPPLYAATIASAERSGNIAGALRRYHYYENRIAALRKKIFSAMAYPVVILAIGGAILLFLLFYVVPRFSQIYMGAHSLPLTARIMLAWGDIVHAYGAVLLPAVVAGICALLFALTRQELRMRLLNSLCMLPKVKHYQRLFHLTRFYRTVGLLLAGGTPAVEALNMTAQLLSPDLKTALLLALDEVRAGKPLSTALPARQLTTPVAERLLRVGEQSGELADMMERIAVFFDAELDHAIDLFTRLFEPLLMAVIGILVGTIVFLLYLPIFELAGSIE
jgi:general secretion pathway protein F